MERKKKRKGKRDLVCKEEWRIKEEEEGVRSAASRIEHEGAHSLPNITNPNNIQHLTMMMRRRREGDVEGGEREEGGSVN